MDSIERLTSLFERFPGIGPRQAQRFVQFLLRSSPTLRTELIESLQALSKNVHQCPMCYRYFSSETKACSICTNPKRDKTSFMIVASDADLLAMEKSGTYKGRYFVLGGTVSLITSEKQPSGRELRIKQLRSGIAPRLKEGLEEIILAFPANPEGDATTVRIKEELTSPSGSLRVTTLGRGLSTGSELEYADPETIKSAIEGRR